MSRFNKIIIALLISVIAIQFIQPTHNESKKMPATDFARIYAVSTNVQTILQNACYDCHSNHTNYPWYSVVQPMAWMMRRHITNGKEGLNFSEFGTYPARRKVSKLKAIANQIRDDEMPLNSYRMMHKNARLSQTEKILVMEWMQKKADSLLSNN